MVTIGWRAASQTRLRSSRYRQALEAEDKEAGCQDGTPPSSSQQAGSMATASQVRIVAYESAMQAMEILQVKAGQDWNAAYDTVKPTVRDALPSLRQRFSRRAARSAQPSYVSEVAEEYF